jgi:hypothetical protein
MPIGLLKPLVLILCAMSALLLWLWPPGFWFLQGGLLALIAWALAGLSKVPMLQLADLSPEAEDLLLRYNRAYSAPALTHIISSLAGCGQLVAVVAGALFLYWGNWMAVSLLAVGFAVCSVVVGKVNPAPYIRRNGLALANNELAAAVALHLQRSRDNSAA